MEVTREPPLLIDPAGQVYMQLSNTEIKECNIEIGDADFDDFLFEPYCGEQLMLM